MPKFLSMTEPSISPILQSRDDVARMMLKTVIDQNKTIIMLNEALKSAARTMKGNDDIIELQKERILQLLDDQARRLDDEVSEAGGALIAATRPTCTRPSSPTCTAGVCSASTGRGTRGAQAKQRSRSRSRQTN